jgi:hypothetical protein
MLESEQCWRHAQECLDLAANNKDPIQNSQLLKMAESWARLAEHAERREGGTAHPAEQGRLSWLPRS